MNCGVKERFESMFGESSIDRPDLPRNLRRAVYERMCNAFEGGDPKVTRRYFMRSFHPDNRDAIFTAEERHAVFVCTPYIFGGEDKQC